MSDPVSTCAGAEVCHCTHPPPKQPTCGRCTVSMVSDTQRVLVGGFHQDCSGMIESKPDRMIRDTSSDRLASTSRL